MVSISRAKADDIVLIAPLFDAYRVFYGQASDLSAAKVFLLERFVNDETLVFLAKYNGKPVGFTQLYKTFSSVTLQQFLILNDLFVRNDYRKKGIGESLLEKAKAYCVERGFKGLALETAIDNPAQKLYERLGWQKSTDFFHYFWTNPKMV